MGESLKNLQRMDALEEANFVRFVRAQMKRNLKSGTEDVEFLVINPPEYIKTMTILNLLIAAPGIREIKARKILRNHIPSDKTVGDLSPRQREMILLRLRKLRKN
jgi:hypothetical protein